MDFQHTEDRQMLVNTLSRYLQDRYPVETRNAIASSDAGWSGEQWAAFAELGIVGALFDEESGGFAGGAFDIAAVFEQLGSALVVEPFLGTMMAGRALAAGGGHEGLLESVIAGEICLAFAHEEPQSHYDMADIAAVAERGGEGWLLTGAKAVVPQIEAASQIVVSARTGGERHDKQGIAFFLVDAGASGVGVRGYPMIDGGRGGELVLDKAAATLLVEDAFPVVEDIVAMGIVALTSEAVGIMDRIKTDTLEYLRVRKQFGVPIGKFQALQHRMANVTIEIEQARSAAINAAAAFSASHAKRERAVSAAKYTIGRAGTIVAEEAIQLHGGIGMTREMPLSHYAKRLTMIGHQLGDEDHHLERFATLGHAA